MGITSHWESVFIPCPLSKIVDSLLGPMTCAALVLGSGINASVDFHVVEQAFDLIRK